jgi:hypothetical protein
VRTSRAEVLSENFLNALKKLFTDLEEPDKVERNDFAPDVFLPSQMIAIELKAISPDLNTGNTAGEQIRKVKDSDIVIFGSPRITLTESEAVQLSEMMTGKLKKRISKAEKQLNNFCNGRDILTVMSVFAEISKVSSRNWDERELPSRDMVRIAVQKGMKNRDIDAFVIFTLDEANLLYLDVMQKRFAESYLEGELMALHQLLYHACKELPYRFDFSEKAEFFSERA